MMSILLPMVLAFLVAGSQWVTNPEDMGKRFRRAQKLMAGGDFTGAGKLYDELLAIPDQHLLHASQVRVIIDEREVGLQAAARYQLANMARKRAQLWRKDAELAAPEKADSLESLARGKLTEAAQRFTALRDELGFELRETAAYLVIECWYEIEKYGDAVEACGVLLAQFPDSRYVLRTRYTLAWAQFERGEFEQAALDFEEYLAQDSTSIRADRARLQLGLSLAELEQFGAALEPFSKLARSYDPATMTYEERTEVALAGLREGQSRRSLAAKAWIKRGDMLKRLDQPEEALAAYKKVGESFPQEERLAEMAWVRQALLAEETHGVDAGLAVYRYAGEQSERPAFRARMQAGFMSLLFEAGRYRESLQAHRMYLDTYIGDAPEAGVSAAEAQFRVAECLRYLGAAVRNGAPTTWADATAGSVEPVGAQAADGGSAVTVAAQVAPRMGAADTTGADETVDPRGPLVEASGEGRPLDSTPDQTTPAAAATTGVPMDADSLLQEAIAAYDEVLRDPECYLAPEALFWQAYALQELGRQDTARAVYERVFRENPQTDLGCRAVLQVARLQEERSDELYEQILDQCAEPEVRAFAALELGHRQRLAGQLEPARKLLASVPEDQPQHLHARMELAQLLVQEGQTGDARDLLEGLLTDLQLGEATPGLYAQIQAQLGLLYQKEGNHAQALRLLHEAIPHLRGEMRASARFGLGWTLFHQEEYDAAWQVWSTSLAKDPVAPEQRLTFLRGLGLCARELRDAERAVSLYQEMIDTPATRVEGLLGLSQFHLDAGNGAEASGPLRILMDHRDRDVALQTRLLLGKALLAQDSLGAAQAALQSGLKLVPEAGTAAQFHFELGSAALGLQDYETARQRFTTALDQATRRELRAAALFYLAHSLRALDRAEEAQARFSELVAQYPDQPHAAEAAFLIGERHYTGEEYTVALEWYGKVYQRWPDSADAPEALYGAAWCALEMKDQEGMQELFLRLAREYPDHLRAHQGLLNLGDYYYNEAKFAKATELYEEVSARFPETQEAVQAQQVLLYLSDVEADSLYQQGMALFDSTEYEQAIPVLERVIEEYPGTPSEAAARCNIGVAHQMMSEHRRATAIYREAIAVLEKREEEWRALAFARENLKWIAENIMSTSLEDVLASP